MPQLRSEIHGIRLMSQKRLWNWRCWEEGILGFVEGHVVAQLDFLEIEVSEVIP